MSHVRRRAARKGFSLLEIIFSLLILSLLLGMTTVSLRGSISREGPRGLAYTLAEDLRAARSEAQRSGTLVAVAFPNEGGANPFSRSLSVWKGEQQGRFHRSISYFNEFEANIFIGSWPGEERAVHELPPGWAGSLRGQTALFFAPDGSAFSSEIGSLEGGYHFVVGGGFQAGTAEGGAATLTAVSHPHTVTVSRTGSISVHPNFVPGGPLPPAAGLPAPASSVYRPDTADASPRILAVSLLPEKVDGLSDAGLGRSYVQIHPSQRQGDNVEYGLATFHIVARDNDGGPLRYRLEAVPSRDNGGTFSQPGGGAETAVAEGRMKYKRVHPTDPALNDYWDAVVCWRPPPGADPRTVYDFRLSVVDPDGNTASVDSGAELFPSIVLLKPPRLVLETVAGDLYLSNLDGTSLMNLTHDGPKEREPFFSSDGTRIYSFSQTGAAQELIMRNADGTDRQVLRSFPADKIVEVEFDPYKMFAAYLTNKSQVDVEFQSLHLQMVDDPDWSCTTSHGSSGDGGSSDSTGGSSLSSSDSSSGGSCDCTPPKVEYWTVEEGIKSVEGHRLVVMHLNSGEEVQLAEYAKRDFRWYSRPRYSLRFQAERPFDERDRVEVKEKQGHSSFPPLPKDRIPDPGYEDLHGDVVIEGFPPRVKHTTLPDRAVDRDVANLARPDWYLEYRSAGGPYLRMVRGSTGETHDLVSEPIEKNPNWSSDGRSIVYAKDSGSGYRIFKREVLDRSYNAINKQEELLYPGTGVSSPALSPDGEYAYFLKDSDLWRISTEVRSEPTNLTTKLPGIRSFALSR